MGKNTDERRWIMENKMRRNILIAAAVLTAAAVIILTVIGLAAENRDYEPASWVLKAYGNSVALYNDGKISLRRMCGFCGTESHFRPETRLCRQ